MHRSVTVDEDNHIHKTLDAIRDALKEVGYNIPE